MEENHDDKIYSCYKNIADMFNNNFANIGNTYGEIFLLVMP